MDLNKKITLIEDHHEALKIWREQGFKGFSLVHIDAHIDFGFHPVKPPKQALEEARSIKDLKLTLEDSLAYSRYETDFEKQTNIGNYIYPAICEGIVRDFYWVIPGKLEEFKSSLKIIEGMLKNFSKQDPYQLSRTSHLTGHKLRDGIISAKLLGKKFVICILEKLPILKERVLLDIDTDFLVTDSLLNASNTAKIGKRTRWIRPDRLVKDLLITKKLKPVFTTIAYSVNSGFTPMRYKILGDELAFRLSPKHFKKHFGQKFIASFFFERFESTGKKEYYQKAIKLAPSYRTADNNYGPLYLSTRKFSKAQKEFLKIAKVDPKNPYALTGLGNIYLQKRKYPEAKRYFDSALKEDKNLDSAILGVAGVELKLNNLTKAKRLLKRYQTLKPMQNSSHNLLGDIYRKEKRFKEAVKEYKSAISLGAPNILDILITLLKIAKYVEKKDDIIKYVILKYRDFKKEFYRAKKIVPKTSSWIKNIRKTEEKMRILERYI